MTSFYYFTCLPRREHIKRAAAHFIYPTQNAELRKARRSWYNQFIRLNKIIQRDYTSFSLYYQIKLPLDLEISIPSDDPVRLVSAFVEEMDLSELYKTYGRIRKNQATPRQMLKLVIYAAMNRIYSSRDIRKAWKRAITKNQARLYTKLTSFVAECEELPFFERYGESLRL